MKRVLFVVAVLAFASTILVSLGYSSESVGQYVDDSVITSDIKAKILTDSELKSLSISVSTNQGNVTLSGQVPNSAAEDRLIQMTKDVKGVKSVNSNLRLAGGSQDRSGSMPPTGRMSTPNTGSGGGESSTR
jgi:hypothetical protein